VFADGTRSRQGSMAAVADGLLAAGQTECVDGEFAADGASELGGDIVLRQRAVFPG
jgi:hypothetical protein